MSIKQLSKKEYEKIKQNNQNIIDLKVNYVKFFEGLYKGERVYSLCELSPMFRKIIK